MSHSTVYALYKTKAVALKELRNGHGSGPAVWWYVAKKLHGKDFNTMNPEDFWGGYKSSELDEAEKSVLLFTYDRMFVEVGELKRFSEACEAVHGRILEETDWTWSHFETIGREAKKLHKEHDYRCFGMTLDCTSVADYWKWAGKDDIAEACGVYEVINSLNQDDGEIK